MPPTTRRQKQYDQKLRAAQNRNFFAWIFSFLAIGGAIVLGWCLFPRKQAKLVVSINRINHTGTLEIPFSKESCEVVYRAFEEQVECELNQTEPVSDIDAESSEFDFEVNYNQKSTLIVYLNGHIATPEASGTAVSFIKPTNTFQGNAEDFADFGKLLAKVKASGAKTKILLLDAGRYAWNPVFPGRARNTFQSQLTKYLSGLKDEELRGFENFWIITSHSDHEISRVSTPLESSLFAKAIADSIASLEKEEVSVREFYDEIYLRTSSWSRNFEDASLQHPVLIKAGELEDAQLKQSVEGERIYLAKRNGKAFENPPRTGEVGTPTVDKNWNQPSNDEARAYAEQLLNSSWFNAAPHAAIQSLERWLELGESVDQVPHVSEEYENILNKSLKQRNGFEFVLSDVEEKQRMFHELRRSQLNLAILHRLRNELRYWDEPAFKELEKAGKEVDDQDGDFYFELSDQELENNESLSDESRDLSRQLPSRVTSFLELHRGLVKRINAQMGSESLTPTEAEILGKLAWRYLPLLRAMGLNDKTYEDPSKALEGSPEDTATVQLSMKLGENSDHSDPQKLKLKSEAAESIVDAAIKDRQQLMPAAEATGDSLPTFSDHAYRFLLAAKGSEGLPTQFGKVPNIDWASIEPGITINAQDTPYRINPFQMNPIEISVNWQEVEGVEFSIKAIETGEGQLPAVDYGFGTDFKPTAKGRSLEIYLQLRQAEYADATYKFTVTGTGRKLADGTQVTEAKEILVRLTQDQGMKLTIKRELGGGLGDAENSEGLVRVLNKPADDLRPAVIKTLKNVKSGFGFSIKNLLPAKQTVRCELVKIVDPIPNITEGTLTADRYDPNVFGELIGWLNGASDKLGPNSDYFQTIAVTEELEIATGEDKELRFKPFSDPIDPDSIEGVKTESNPGVNHGLLLLVYRPNAPTSEKPTWVQWLKFEPRSSADANEIRPGDTNVELRSQLDNVLGDRLVDTLKEDWDPNVSDPNERWAAIKTEISSYPYGGKQTRLKLEDVLAEASVSITSSSKNLIMLDLLGVPDYKNWLPSSLDAAEVSGIRIRPKNKVNTKCYPETWSFAAAIDESPAELKWLLGENPRQQDVFVRFDGKEGESESISLEFALPKSGDSGNLNEDIFEYVWQTLPRKKLYFRNQQDHSIDVRENDNEETEITIWSQLYRHATTLSERHFNFIDGDSPKLSLYREGVKKPLGIWTFHTPRSKGKPSLKPSLKLSRYEVYENQLENVDVTIDMREIVPPIPVENISIFVDNEELKDKAAVKFLTPTEGQRTPGVYKFTASDLFRKLGVSGDAEPRTIEVEATDFFGRSLVADVKLTITKPKRIIKKKASKPPPQPVDLTLTFVGNDGKPFTSRSSNFSRLKISGPINLLVSGSMWGAKQAAKTKSGQPVSIYPQRVGQQGRNPRELKINGLVPGTYTLSVTATSGSRTKTFSGTVKIPAVREHSAELTVSK